MTINDTVLLDEKTINDEDKMIYQKRFAIGDYELVIILYVYKADGTHYYMFEPKVANERKFLPYIYYHGSLTDEDGCFKIQTSSYGSLNAEDIRKMMDGYEYALEAVEVMQTIYKIVRH